MSSDDIRITNLSTGEVVADGGLSSPEFPGVVFSVEPHTRQKQEEQLRRRRVGTAARPPIFDGRPLVVGDMVTLRPGVYGPGPRGDEGPYVVTEISIRAWGDRRPYRVFDFDTRDWHYEGIEEQVWITLEGQNIVYREEDILSVVPWEENRR